MSVDLYFEQFDMEATLSAGRMHFGYAPVDEVAAFFEFAIANPDHVYRGDGMEYPCSVLVERYIEPGRWTVLSRGDIEDHLRKAGWLRDDGDGERMHLTRASR